MKIQVLGTGCARCENLYNNAVEAVGRLEMNRIEIEKVRDPEVFLRLKVFMTPALVINGEVISSGKVLTPDEIESELLKRGSGDKDE
ncbi:MAG: thioredoxin family protein [Desulfomonilaceae bacterium]